MHLSFQRNLGDIDRTIRVIVGIGLIYAVFVSQMSMSTWLSALLGLFGAAMIIEGALGY